MHNNLSKNKIYILFKLILWFLSWIFFSIILLIKNLIWKKTQPLKENKFLDVINFLFHIWPKKFWQNPTWLKIGRSIATFLCYVFEKEDNFKEKK